MILSERTNSIRDKQGRPITAGCPIAVAFCDRLGWHGESCEPYLLTGKVIEVRENSCKEKELTIKELEKMMKEVVKEFFANDGYVDLDTVLITVEDKYSFIDVEGRFGEECSEENHFNFKLCYSTRDSFEFIKGKFVQIVEDLLK